MCFCANTKKMAKNLLQLQFSKNSDHNVHAECVVCNRISHALQGFILNSRQILQKSTSQNLKDFLQRFFRPERNTDLGCSRIVFNQVATNYGEIVTQLG